MGAASVPDATGAILSDRRFGSHGLAGNHREERTLTDPIESHGPPEWIETIQDVSDRSAIVTVRKRDGRLVGYVVPRRTLIESVTDGHTNGHVTTNGAGESKAGAD